MVTSPAFERPQSQQWFARARRVIPGGVNSPSRSYQPVGQPIPVCVARAEGAYLHDVDGRRYIDYIQGFGALILGHGHPAIVEAVRRAAAGGTLYGANHPEEAELAERLATLVPSLQRMRMTASGTEAVMSAVRLARAWTRRSLLVKFAGSYHGHFDPVLVGGAGSGASTLGIDESAGVPDGVARDVLTLPYNDAEAVEAALRTHGPDTACVLVEPVVGNFGLVPPRPSFLERLVRAARRAGALVIFDEVITAFRFRYGAIQDELGLQPDLTTLGKIIGGGLPIGIFGGRADVMEMVAPAGPVYQDGTWAGNPVSVQAALACLDLLPQPPAYDHLDRLGRRLGEGLRELTRDRGVPAVVHQKGGAISLYFTDAPEVIDAAALARCDTQRFSAFHREMMTRGVLLPPSPYEVWFLSRAHTDREVDQTLEAAAAALAHLPGA